MPRATWLLAWRSLTAFADAWKVAHGLHNRRRGEHMPEQRTIERAKKDAEEGKAPSTQAGEFVREEMDHIREGKHGARSAKQAIAIGLSKARRAGVKLPPAKGNSDMARRTARDYERGQEAP